MSVVEQTLRQDPGGVYSKMDFATRDRYRHVVEKIAKSSRHSESQVARASDPTGARGRGQERRRRPHGPCRLLPDRQGIGAARADRGTAPLLLSEALRRVSRRFPLLLYVGTIMLITAIITGSFLAKAQADGLSGWMLGLIGILSLLGASHLAIALVNWLATLLVRPHAAAAPGLLRRNSAGIAHPGGGPDYAHEPSEHRGL